MDLQNLKKEKGITLIALAVTIVVLLILAGVTISAVFSENGIIKKAQQAQTAIDKAKENDLAEIQNLVDEMNKYENGEQNVNEDDYSTLNIQSYVGKYVRQKADYLKMYVEFINVADENDKIVFNIGTDWKDKIDNTNNQNLTFLKNNVQLDMIQNLSTDNKYSSDNTKMSRAMLSAFTDVKISNLKVKKGNNYTIQIFVQGTEIKNGTAKAVNKQIYSGETGIITENSNEIVLEKSVDVKNQIMYDFNGDGYATPSDGPTVASATQGYYGASEYVYSVNIGNTELTSALQLLDSNGEKPINEDLLGFDVNRDGYISQDDVYITNCMGGGSET